MSERDKAIEHIFFLPPTALRLRFDPIAQAGAFRLGAVSLRGLGRARAALAMCRVVATRVGWRTVVDQARHAGAFRLRRAGARRFVRWLAVAYQGPESDAAAAIATVVHASAVPSGAAPDSSPAAGQPGRIQVYRRNALGDVLLATPILRALRQKFPRAHIAFTTLYPGVLDGNPNVDEVVRAPAPLAGYDLTIDLEYERLPEMHIVDAYARIAGVEVKDRTPELRLSLDALEAADATLREAGVRDDRPIVALHMESGWKVRDWSIDRFRDVARALQARGVQVVVIGERPTVACDFAIDLRGRTTLKGVMGLLFKCDLLVGVDSGLMHVAAALRRPFVALFGCTDPEKRVPDWALGNVIYARIVCHGCHHRQRPLPVTTAPVCPFETVRCMEEIEAAQVIDRVTALLDVAARPAVSIVVPHYRHYDVLERCLESLFRVGSATAFEVIVVDDSGENHPDPRIDAWRPRVRVIRNPRNLGFAASCNAGIAAARGEYVVLLNNDTTVTAGWLDRMRALYDSDPQAGIVGPKLLYPGSDAIQHCGTVINELGVAEHLYRFLPCNLAGASRVRRYRALTGACMLMKRQHLLDAGGLDPAYRNGGEDTDLCFTFLNQGLHLLYCPESVVYHHEGYSRGLRGLDDSDDVFNRERLRGRWAKYLTPDIDDFCLLAEIEAAEGRTWPALEDVPADLREKYDSSLSRSVGRYPFRCEIGSGMNPQPGYLHLDVMPHAPSLDILHDVSRPFPFLDGTVREVLANHVIEHVGWRDLPMLIADLCRILAPHGRAFIRTPNLRFIAQRFLSNEPTPEHPDDEAAMRRGYGELTAGLWANIKLFSGQDYPSNFHFNCMDPEDLRKLFLRCGFREARLERFGREFSPGEIQLVAEK
jgi:GT2 family glycosyltransferase/ADP-heptose:LPS heptosyltransferase/predicted SAM-dependent methyltransferase